MRNNNTLEWEKTSKLYTKWLINNDIKNYFLKNFFINNFPIWWITASLMVTWLLLSSSSPVFSLLNMHWLLAKLTMLNPILVFLILLIWWPISGKMHLKLYSKLVQSWRMLKRWQRWRDKSLDWNSLQQRQQTIGSELISLGDKLVLPGDPEWIEPKTGNDDNLSVRFRN